MRSPIIAAALLSLSACIVYDTDTRPAPINDAPIITWAEAGCFWDSYAYDWVWYFDADVTDPDGKGDVWEVYADVLDDRTGQLVDSFLLADFGGGYWSTEWLQHQTWLDCASGWYVVEFVAYDYMDYWDSYAVYPYQSW
jgi:hypothetical protein